MDMGLKTGYKKFFKKNKYSTDEFEIYRSLVENSLDLFYRTDTDGCITYISPSVYHLSGYTVEEAVGMNMAREIYLIPEERTVFLEHLKQKGEVKNFKARLKKKDGSIWWASTNARIFRGSKGNILGVEGVTRDITTLKQADQALQESEERFRLAFHTSPDAINLTRVSDGKYVDINQGFTDLTGYTLEDVSGENSVEVKIWKYPADRKRLTEELQKNGYVKNFEAQFVTKSGQTLTGLMSARIFQMHGQDFMLSIARDITELKQAQEIMVQSEKMLSVGGLSAGMAHEINNPLAGMIQNAELITRRLADESLQANIEAARDLGLDMKAIQTYMEKRGILKMAAAIKKSGIRLADIVDNMLSFSRKSNGSISSCSIPELLDKTVKLAETDFDLKDRYDFKNIEIKRVYEKNLPLISCEATKLQQVFLNILNNGAHAMQEAQVQNPGFVLKVWADTFKQKLCIEIEDNGPGMDEDIQKRIFDPFFTTKPVGEGTGLGLSVSYFIITKHHKGEIEVESEKGKGTRFIIRLPFMA